MAKLRSGNPLAAGVSITLAAALLAAATPAAAQDAPKEEPPPSEEAGESEEREPAPTVDEGVLRYPPSSVRIGLLAGGIGLLGVSYGLTAMSSRLWPEVPGADAMLVPIAGPWVALGQSGCSPQEDGTPDPDGCTGILVLRTILLVLDGLAQAGAAGIIGEGLFMTTEAESADTALAPRMTVVPDAGPGRMGLSVVGTF